MSRPAPNPVHFSSARCESCGEVHPDGALDDAGLCPECQERRARWLSVWPHVIASLIVVPFAVWVLVVEKTAYLPWYAWLLPLGAAYYLGLRIGREMVRGYIRLRHRS